jgi:AmmeMemoRadiSam system protein B
MRVRADSPTVRPAAVAGSFYPRDPGLLRQEVANLLIEAPDPQTGRPKALIAPHAGYAYSGPVAGRAFATIADDASSITRVVVVGPAHYVSLRGIAVPAVEAFETPLGRVPLDHDALSALCGLPFVMRADAPHAPEHAIEVELPFLQLVLRRFTLVPLLVGDAHPKQVAEAIGRLWGGPETIVVVSSDLSHFHDYRAAQGLDAATAAAIEQGDWTRLRPDNACGFLAIAGLLQHTTALGLRARRVALCNSGDTAGPRERVVGYGAWAFTPDNRV